MSLQIKIFNSSGKPYKYFKFLQPEQSKVPLTSIGPPKKSSNLLQFLQLKSPFTTSGQPSNVSSLELSTIQSPVTVPK